ncbi:MAG: lysylphosphatidylglycerol synthase domain-containing protein, partial [Tepidiformaceae bacterium]
VIEWGGKRWDHSARSPGHSPGRLRRTVHSLINDARHGLQLFRHPLRATVAVVAGIVSWLANLAAIWFTLLAFGITNDAFAVAIVVFAVSNLVGVVQFTPGNVGVFQVTIAVALGSAFGLSTASALSFGIGLQAIEVGLGAGLGLLFLAVEGLSIGGVRREMANSESASQAPPALAPNPSPRGIPAVVPAAKPEEVTSR